VRETAPDAWIADGMVAIDAVNSLIPGFEEVANAEDDAYQTLVVFIMQLLERLPREAEKFTAGQFELEIIDIHRQRIAKVGVRRKADVEVLKAPNVV
jgi:CBS domain containing-hemolysin-like protein